MEYLWQQTRGARRQTPSFVKDYRCFTVAAKGRQDLETGDKIILPESAVVALSRMRVAYPMLFQLTNRQTQRTTHCSVMEFTGEEGVCYIPLWMMENLGLYEGAILNVKNVSLEKAKFTKFQPHKTAFTKITNPKAVLEQLLRKFSCLTTGDTLCIEYNHDKYYINVLEVRPNGKACIIETDCEVDFAPPLDYKENEDSLPAKKRANLDGATNNSDEQGGGGSKDEILDGSKPAINEKNKKSQENTVEDDTSTYFQSTGYRVDGKPLPKSTKITPKKPTKTAAQLRKESEEKAAYRKRFDEARKAVAERRALRFGKVGGNGTVRNKYQMFSGVGHNLD